MKKKDPKKFNEWKFGTTTLSFHDDGAGKQAFVNTSRGQISAKTNYRRNVVEKVGDRRIRVKCVDGTIRNYKRSQGGDERYHLDTEILPNGNKIRYYMGSFFQPVSIESFSPVARLYSKVEIKYFRDLKDGDHTKPINEKVKVLTHTNKQLECIYDVEESDNDYPCFVLKHTYSHYGHTSIQYQAHSVFFLNEYRAPQNRAMIFKYHLGAKRSSNYKKVSEILMLKNNNHAFTTHFFTYDANVTTVKDGLGNDTKYHYNQDHLRIDKIERHQNINGSQYLKNREKFIWGGDNQAGFLIGKVIYDENNNPIKEERYNYDEENKGNIIRKTIYGNISNTSPISIKPVGDSLSSLSGVDVNIEEYTHTQNGSIQSETKQNGLKTEYAYHICQIDGESFHTDLVAVKFIRYEGQIKQRFFYEYDEHNVLIKEIEDDGSAENKEDLTKVSRRLIKKYTPRDIEPFGLTEIYEELYLDLETRDEKLIKKEVYDYTIDCNMTKKDVYGSDRKLKYTLSYRYDHKDNLTYESDPIGREAQYQYDESNNKIYEKDFSGKETFFYFDNCNRLIKKITKDIQKEYVEEFDYDANHNKIYEKNIYGNITREKYDCIGNKIKELLPQVEDIFGAMKNPEISYRYDALDRQIEKRDAEGNITKTSHNLFNKPTIIEHPDNTREEYFYNLDGTLDTYINQLGTKTKYEYDYLQRVVSKKTYSSDDEFLQDEYFEYSAFDLISKKDSDGNITSYTYDGAGRKIKEKFLSNNNKLLSVEELFYDALGFVEKKIEGDKLITAYQLDNRGRIKKIRQLNNNQELLSKAKYKYDLADNKIEIISYITGVEDNIRKNLKSTEYKDYDVFKRLVKTRDAYDNETSIIYEEDSQNKLIQKIIENSLHQKIISTYDAQNREKTIKHLSPTGTVLSFDEKFYDFNSNLIRQISYIYNSLGEELKQVTTFWKFDSMNKPILITEAYDTNDEKTTCYIYKYALLHKTIKPDKTILKYKYDALSNQIELKSKNNFENSEQDENLSNQQIHYKFTYNKLNQLTFVEDVYSNKTTKRKYDAKNHLLKEKQASGLVIKNEYDLLGNKIKCIFPDKSFVEYQYNPINLKKVIRTPKDKEPYEHEFTRYDLSGNLLHEKLAENAGDIFYHIDKLQRVIIVDSPYHSQNAQYDEIGRISNINWQGFLDDENSYLYDDLNQITKEEGLFPNNYEFDSHFNRLTKNEDQYEINSLNELLSTNQRVFEYDKNGNPILKKTENGEIRFFYDALDRLIKTEKPNEYTLIFTYDSFNRRISKKAIKSSKCCLAQYYLPQRQKDFKYFLYDDQNEIGSFDKELNQKELRILADTKKAEIGSAISFELDDFIYTPIYDISGNVTSLIFVKTLIEHYRYSAFGEEKTYKVSRSLIFDLFKSSPWRFSSKRIDDETNLVYYGRRYYDPEIGRWLTPDPQGFTDGLNLYAFVNNDPLINIDLYGLEVLAHLPGPLFYEAVNKALGRKPTQIFDLSRSEISPHKRIYFTNGIYNSLQESRESAQYLSKMVNNSNIHGIYNENEGPASDILRAGISLTTGVQSKASKLINSEWVKYLDQDEKNEILHICHSEGNINTRNALKNLPNEYKKKISVVGIAPAAYMGHRLAKSIIHYVADKDFVPKLDFENKRRYSDSVSILNSQVYESKQVHNFQHPIYEYNIEKHIKEFINR